MNDDGATKLPGELDNFNECMERWRHSWLWIWENGKWTDKQRCGTCDTTRTMFRGDEERSS